MTKRIIDTSTALYCVLGSPVSHSKSPIVHNGAFRDHNINAVYLAFEPEDIGKAVSAMRTLSIRGASVTIRFKESVISYLDWIDPMAREIGAVNTLVNEGGMLKGYNTDCRAAVDPILAHGSIRDKRICIVGAGGAARAVAHGAASGGAGVIVTNRTREKGMALADNVGGTFVPAEDAGRIQADVVINTTSLGMAPNADVMSFPEKALVPGMLVMDVVYTPIDTCLLKTARSKGCKTIDGLTMFLAQAAAQFFLWTGKTPDIERMRKDLVGRGPEGDDDEAA